MTDDNCPIYRKENIAVWKTKDKFLVYLSCSWRKNEGKSYPQTWYYMPKRKRWPWTCKALQWLCGLTGHELSKTEWGYGGGKYADRWCRWCNKMIVVPKESIYFQFKKSDRYPNPKELMNGVGKELPE